MSWQGAKSLGAGAFAWSWSMRNQGQGAYRLPKGQTDLMVEQHPERGRHCPARPSSAPGILLFGSSLTCNPGHTPYRRDQGRCSSHLVPTRGWAFQTVPLTCPLQRSPAPNPRAHFSAALSKSYTALDEASAVAGSAEGPLPL